MPKSTSRAAGRRPRGGLTFPPTLALLLFAALLTAAAGTTPSAPGAPQKAAPRSAAASVPFELSATNHIFLRAGAAASASNSG